MLPSGEIPCHGGRAFMTGPGRDSSRIMSVVSLYSSRCRETRWLMNPSRVTFPFLEAPARMDSFRCRAAGICSDRTLHARNAMQVFLPVDGRLHGAIFPCGTYNVFTGRSTSLPGTGRRFPHDLTDAVRVHPAKTNPLFYVLSCHDMPSWTMTTFYRRGVPPGCPSSSQGR